VRLIIVTAFLPHGTFEAFVVPEVAEFVRLGHEVLVVPRSPRGRVVDGRGLLECSRVEAICSANVLKATAARTVGAPGNIAAAVRIALGGRRGARFKNLSIVPKAVWLAEVAERWGADHIHCHWAGTTATMAMLASRLSNVPWSMTAHRWDIVENNMLAAKVSSASFVRFISEDGLRMAQSLGVGSPDKLRVLHMGVGIPRKVRRQPGRKPVVLCPARLAEVKGHRVLLEAWRILQRRGTEGELWLAGDGPLRRELEYFSETLGVSGSAKFLGSVPHNELLKFYEEGRVSAVALASLDLGNGHHEGIPVGLVEAMSYAVPVVATAAGGTTELLAPGIGLLVPPGDAAALAESIKSLLEDRELSERLGRFGREHVARDYDVARIAAALANEFESAARSATAGLVA
jgi:colanic acid/amylovoran biosynthesis glycosyltransferase